MKVLVNGGLNCSELDGWWAEAYTPRVGWALGDGRKHGDDAGWDAAEADRLYTLLETEIVPEFYRRNEAGVPEGWIARVCESLGTLTPEFSANRAVRQYMEQHYLPAAQAYLARAEDKGKGGIEVLNWRREVEAHWRNLRVAAVKVESDANRHVFTVQVYLDELSADAVRAEVYAALALAGAATTARSQSRTAVQPAGGQMELGAFSISLTVKDLGASRQFYEKFGFRAFAGDASKNWLILKNGDHVIGLFQGVFEKNILTFNPGWDSSARKLAAFTDVRELQRQLKAQRVKLVQEADESTSGPASFIAVDPDGNPILVDQHV
jgi:catechol 2,3-dioxygenase-like lactoylglutathione lyase family enzyme